MRISLRIEFLLACAIAVSTLLVSGCTSQQLYATGQGWQRNECNKLLDQSERERCMRQADTSYDDYKRQTSDDRKP